MTSHLSSYFCPQILTSFDDLVYNNHCGAHQMVTFYLFLPFPLFLFSLANWNSAKIKNFSLSLIYMFNYLFKSVQTYLFYPLKYNLLLPLISLFKMSQIWPLRVTSSQYLCIFYISSLFFGTSQLSGTIRCSTVSIYSPYPCPAIIHFF